MSKRLSKIVTKTGDKGETGLGDGSRVPKHHPRVQAYGSVDELNSFIGLLVAEVDSQDINRKLSVIQHDLFDLGGELCIPGREMLRDEQVERLEKEIETFNQSLEELKEFILPGGAKSAALAHVCRTICRRVERELSGMQQGESINPVSFQYVNRLSDWFFVVARILNANEGVKEVYWQSDFSRT